MMEGFLKVKDNYDISQLTQFGFKAKYDEDTGEICRFINKKETCKGITIYFEIGKTWRTEGFVVTDIDIEFLPLLYDLIISGILEKVEEE